MNKKIIFYYFLIALIAIISITDSSHTALMSAKFDVDETLAFWTPERIKSAEPLILKNVGFRNKTTSGTKNVKITDYDNDQQLVMPPFDNPNNPLNYPVGRLLFSNHQTGNLGSCTASMINTENGNIGITAAHCLFNGDGIIYNDLMFSPGYNGIPGPLGLIPVESMSVPTEYDEENVIPDYDYGMIRMRFNDPNGYKLQQYTGANGWRLNVEGDNIVTTIFGYPNGGDMPNCARDGEHLCTFVGNAKTADTTYVIPGVNLGSGASGAPMMVGYIINRNLGYIYSDHSAYFSKDDLSLAPYYIPEEFHILLDYASTM